ncbi:MAG: hypothetical protein KC486_08245 [Myxococcales bacterium]|nr:hypothetical protein [Myxococcales bacterium]
MTTLRTVEAEALEIPFKASFSHSLATRSRMASTLVRAVADDGARGYGEGCPRAYVTDETLDDALERCRQAAPALTGGSLTHAAEIHPLLDAALGQEPAPAARCALELALLELLARDRNLSVRRLLGGREGDVRYSGVASGDDPARVGKLAARMAQVGFAQVKIKVGRDLERNLALVRAVDEAFAGDVELRVDANACWDLAEARAQIAALRRVGVLLFEQPMPAAARDDYRRLRPDLPGDAAVMIDESLVDLEDARWFIEARAADRFLLKISKHGGLLPTLRIAALAREAAIPCHLGCHVGESSLLSAAGRTLAGLVDLASVEGSFGRHLLERDVVSAPLEFGAGGWAPLAYDDGPGWGLAFTV